MARFFINTEVLPVQFHWKPTHPVTGTTKYYVRTAEELVKAGHFVVVEYDGHARVFNGVRYVPRGTGPGPIADIQLDCNIDTPLVPGPRRFQWTSFFGRFDTCVGRDYEGLFLVSDYVHSTLQHIVEAPVTVIELGCDIPTVAGPRLSRRDVVCCYTSSPDRGGTFLDRVWPEVQKRTGYRLERSPYRGDFSPSDVEALLLNSRFWVYPATGMDSIISALEAQAAGCIPIYVPHMALPQTCRYGVQSPDLWRFADTLVRTLSETNEERLQAWESARKVALEARPIPTWADATARLLEAIGI